jgi:hypothetical protein
VFALDLFSNIKYMIKVNVSILILTILALTGCASGYTTIQPKFVKYVSYSNNNNVELEYKYDVLQNKYAKREFKKDVKLIAVRITNNSDKELMFGRDILITYENGKEAVIMDYLQVFRNLRQRPALYLFYLLLTPLNIFATNSSGKTTTIPIGLVVGPGVSGGNIIGASVANKNFKNELIENDIIGDIVKPGETIYGLIGLKLTSYEALKIKVDVTDGSIQY